MRKHLHRKPEFRTTKEYVRELSRLLRLPEADASAIVDEADAHLQDHVEDLIRSGVPAAAAEVSALGGFGSPRAFARRLSNSVYETFSSHHARLCGRVLLSGVFGLLLAEGLIRTSTFECSLPPWLEVSTTSIFCRICLIGIGIAVCGFLSRRAHTLLIAAGGAAFILASLLVTSSYTTAAPYDHQLVHRQRLRENIDWYRRQVPDIAKELRLLDEGALVYEKPRRPEDIPADLRIGSRYIVPTTWNFELFAIRVSPSLPSAFQAMVPMPGSKPHKSRITSEAKGYTYLASTVSSEAEARQRWTEDGDIWRLAKARERAHILDKIDEYKMISTSPDRFDIDVFWWRSFDPLLITLLIAALDYAGAWAGRRIFLVRRQLRRRDLDLVK